MIAVAVNLRTVAPRLSGWLCRNRDWNGRCVGEGLAIKHMLRETVMGKMR